MSEVSDSSNSSSAPESSAIGAQLVTPGQFRRLSQQDASSTNDLFDKILTVSSAGGEHVLPIKVDGVDNTIALGAGTPGTTELRVASDAMSPPGIARDQGLTITDASASHLGDMLQSDPVTVPNFGDARASQQASTSLADRSTASSDVANDILDAPAPGPWHDAGSGTHRSSALSHGTDLNDDAGSGASDPSRHSDHRPSSALDILSLDSIIDPTQHHNSTPVDHHNAPANDDAKPAKSAQSDALKIVDAPEPAGHVSANHNDAAGSGTGGLASDEATTHQAQATSPSTGALVESGAKAILLATDESSSRNGPHASVADLPLGSASSQVHSAAHTAAAFSPGVLGARDQLASAIATATPEAAAMTTLPTSQTIAAAIPTLGSDVHALQKHAA